MGFSIEMVIKIILQIEISVRKFTDDHYLLFAESEEDNLILSRTLKQGVVIPVFKVNQFYFES